MSVCFGGCLEFCVFLMYLIIAFYSPVTTKLLNTVHWLILLLKTFKGDNFLKSSKKSGLKGAAVSHPDTHFRSSAWQGVSSSEGSSEHPFFPLPCMVNRVLPCTAKIKS